ncbi:fucose translocator with 8 transmembrane domains [Cryptosporidium sp. chipmunk genotype I]|uniref:fucose translocator with 8 transmembrane domains n=1 Tax=Cryptosporidium sp. chipmunk genotype I TaxID=1280935 RepID=UPI00351A3BFF|nr:fucose translocator with 8 transmembrane domains [Cryptosporidium sp. chipmunk genotype I]
MGHSKNKKGNSTSGSEVGKESERFISFLPNSVTTVLAICSFIAASISSVYFNNNVFKKQIKFPVFVSCAQQLVGMIIMSIFGLLRMAVSKSSGSGNGKDGTEGQANSSTVSSWKKVMYAIPVAFFFSFNISFNNICLTHGKVSTYAMAKSTTLMWSLCLQFLILGIKVKLTSLISCAIIISGVLIGAFDPKSLVLVSLIYGCISSFSQSCYNITLKWVLPKIGNDSAGLLKYVQMWSILFFFIPMFGTGEVIPAFTTSGCFDFNDLNKMMYLWGLITTSALLAIGVNQSTYVVIGLTTPATFNVCGLVKQALQTIGGIFYLGESLPTQTIIAVCLTFCGSASYTAFNHFGSKPSMSPSEMKAVEEKYKEVARQSVGTASDVFENAQDDILKKSGSKTKNEITPFTSKNPEAIPLKDDIEEGLPTGNNNENRN